MKNGQETNHDRDSFPGRPCSSLGGDRLCDYLVAFDFEFLIVNTCQYCYDTVAFNFVFLDKRICDAFRSFFRNNKLNNPMSTLLIDLSDGSIVSEDLLNQDPKGNIPKLFELPLINDGSDDEDDLFEDPLVISDLNRHC